MASDGRCACGCRIFFDLNARITCADGRAFSIPNPQVSVCVGCGTTVKILGGNGERKTIVPFRAGKEGERDLFLAAIECWKNEHSPERNDNYITIGDEDRKDFDRLGIPHTEVVVK